MENTTTLYTCAWNGYWEKYGEEWVKQVKNLETQPDEIFVISDKELPTCPYTVYICELREPWPVAYFRKTAIEKASCEWLTFSDLDDIMYPCYLNGIDSNYDMLAISLQYYDVNKNLLDKTWISSDYIELWESNFNPKFSLKKMAYPNQSFVKTSVLKNLKLNKYGFEDVTLHYKLRKLNIKVKTDSTIRYGMVETPNSLSRNKHYNTKIQQTMLIKQYILENKTTPLHLQFAEEL